MKLKTLAAAAAVGMALSSGADAAPLEFYDFTSNTQTYVDGTSPVNIGITTTITSLVGYTVSLQLLLSDDGDPADGEGAVINGDTNYKINVAQGTTAAWYTWGGNVANLLTSNSAGYLFSKTLTASPSNKDFYYYNSRLVFTAVPVPEASELLLMGAGLVAVGAFARKRRAGAQLA